MAWILGAVMAVGLLLLLGKKKPGASPPADSETPIRNDSEKREEAIRHRGDLALEAALRLPIVPLQESPLLHDPVYDCVEDLFQRPCAHPTFDLRGSPDLHHSGFIDGRAELERCLRMIVGRNSEGSPAVELPGRLEAIYASTLLGPGGEIWRLVRTGEEQWYGTWWRAGMRPSASEVDPPFWMAKIRKNPALWSRREEELRSRLASNRLYLAERERCPHRKAGRESS